jgi:cytochrome c peroxidase
MKNVAVVVIFVVTIAGPLHAHDANGRSGAPIESRRLVNPVRSSEAVLFSASANYATLCVSCHGADGKSRTKQAGSMTYRPTDLTNYAMQGMKDGEIYWILTNGAEKGMPAFTKHLSETARWELVHWVRELRTRELYVERVQLGSYEWQLPPGFPHPNVPADNLMTAGKVELGRHLFYDRRLSANGRQSCATCHRQDKAFTDGRARGLGSTGELHPRGPMSLINVAYSPVLTWANPNLTRLEQQALVPVFGEHPLELGMSGKEELLLDRLKAEPRYRRLVPAAFPGEAQPFTIGNVTRAIASFERTLLSGDSPYDEYRRGDDPDAISESAKRGEKLFFGERAECFHCHGGFNFTGTVDYLGKGAAEIEFHNNGLYEKYPADNQGLFEFTRKAEDAGRFRAPTLRNIGLTGPYMHDGSIKTLEAAVDHYSSGGRDNAGKSEFVKPFALPVAEKADLVAFLRSLTDPYIAAELRWSDPWHPLMAPKPVPVRQTVRGEVIAVYSQAGTITLRGDETRDYLVRDKRQLEALKPGLQITAGVRRRGGDYVLEQIRWQEHGNSRGVRIPKSVVN